MAADLTTTFAVDTRADSSETDKLADSLERTHDRMVDNEKAVKELQAGLRRLKASAATNTEEFKAMRTELEAKKAAVAADQLELVKLAGSAAEAAKQVAAHKQAKKEAAAAQEAAAKKAEDQAAREAAAAKKAAEDTAAAEAAAAKKAEEAAAKEAAAAKKAAEQAAAAEAAAAKKAAEEAAAAKVKAEEKAAAEQAKMADAAAARVQARKAARTQTKDTVLETEQKAAAEQAKMADAAAARVKARAAAREQTKDTVVKSLREEAEAEKEAMNAISGRTVAMNLGKMAAVAAATAAAAAMVAVYAAIARAAQAFVMFAVAAADAARSAALLREATTGSAAGAAQLDAQVSALAAKLPGARAGIEELGLALVRAELSGRALELAFSAVATTAAVMGQQAGGIIQGIAERAKMSKRFILGAFDLKGTGLKIADVAQALAGRLKISFQAAMGAIQNGQVGMEVGLAALKDATDKKFGAIAAAMKLSLPNQLQKARDDLGRLFNPKIIEPFLAGLASVLSLLDETSVTGQALKTIVEVLFNPLFAGAGEAAPLVRSVFKGAVVGALLLTIQLLTLKKEYKGLFAGVQVDPGKVFRMAIGAVMYFAQGLMLTVRAGAFLVSTFIAVYGAVSSAIDFISSINLGEIGANIAASLAGGISSMKAKVMAAAADLAAGIPGPIKKILGIASPSKLMIAYGRWTGQGMAQGLAAGTNDVEDAAAAMAQAPVDAVRQPGAQAPAGAGGARAAGRGVVIHQLNINGVRDADQLADETFLDKLASAIERAGRAAGGGPVELVEATA